MKSCQLLRKIRHICRVFLEIWWNILVRLVHKADNVKMQLWRRQFLFEYSSNKSYTEELRKSAVKNYWSKPRENVRQILH